MCFLHVPLCTPVIHEYSHYYCPPVLTGRCRIVSTKLSPFGANSVSGQIFFLSDHIAFLQALAADWTRGPPPDLLHFVPFDPSYKFRLTNYKARICFVPL